MKIVVPETLWRQLYSSLANEVVESAGIALANHVGLGDATRLLVSEIHQPGNGDYQVRNHLEATLSPDFVASVVRKARDRRMSVVFFHTHPFSEAAEFSPKDDRGEKLLASFVEQRIPGLSHAALVLGRQRPSARILGSQQGIDVTVVGPTLQRFSISATEAGCADTRQLEVFDRQVRILGADSQKHLGSLRIGIVGLGGTGSIVTEQLTHLGITNFVLVDADVIEHSNLNRVVGASSRDVGRPKVDVAADLIRRIQPHANVEAVQASVLRNSTLTHLQAVDAIFCCTDSHGSRYVLNELAYRFLIPSIDCGVVIAVNGEGVTHISARVQMLAPGLACLTCNNLLDPEQVRRDLLTDFERAQDPYITGASVPQPAVISLNGVTVSLAATMFLGSFGGLPTDSRHQRYDAMKGTVRNVDTTPTPHCVTCSVSGGLAVGTSWPLPGRPE